MCDICRILFAHKGALQTHEKFPSNPFCSWFRKALVGRRLRSYYCPNTHATNALGHKSLAMKIILQSYVDDSENMETNLPILWHPKILKSLSPPSSQESTQEQTT